MSEEINADDRMMLESLYWWDIPTLFRCPIERDPSALDIALVGVPHSTGNGTTERDQHLGPRAVRDISALARRVHTEFQIDPWKSCRIGDMGDVPLPEANDNERCIERMTDFYRAIDSAGARPVSIGGDHAITGGIIQAIAGEGARLTGGRKAAFLHFDAHTDAFEQIPHFLGAKKSAAHWAAYLVRSGLIDASRSVQIGMRGNPRTLDWWKTSSDLGYEVVPIKRYRELGPEKTIQLINTRIGDAPLYITFDLDCMDPTVCPGVANLECGIQGFQVDEVMQLLRCVRGKNIIGGDVVCLMPTKDHPNKQTAHFAAAVMFEILSLIADNSQSK
ncbi:MAG: arginase family protein [Gammaproteobacteria bacterium]|nr:arginase family protein [Gammaproteobacteria bacterium]MDH3448817.1 arginase family protein [Gammaproteobacteria bacterium]